MASDNMAQGERAPRYAAIETQRLILRSPRVPDDVENVLARVRDKACVQYIPHLLSASPTTESITGFLESCRQGSGIDSFFLIFERKDDHTLIGDGGFESLTLDERRGNAGLMLNSSPDVRGQGYAEEAMGATIEWGLRPQDKGGLGLDKVIMWTRFENRGFRGLMKRLGVAGVETQENGVKEMRFEVSKDSEEWQKRTWTFLK